MVLISADVKGIFTQDFEVEDLFCGASSGSESTSPCSSAIISKAWGLSLFKMKMTFSMTLLG